MSTKEPGLTIQEVVKLTGLTSRTLRWYDEMLATIALALSEERGEYTMKDTERFQGFGFSHNPHEKEARLRWGDEAVDSANERLGSMDEQQKVGMSESMKTLFTELAAIRHMDPTSMLAQQAIGRWYELLNTMGTYTPEMFANLGRLYVEDQRFTQNIDSYGAGLARFMCDAMDAFRESGKSNSKQ